MFIVARFLIGFGDVIVITTAPLLIAEISRPQDRAVLVTMAAVAYYLGAFIAAWATYSTLKIQERANYQNKVRATLLTLSAERLGLESS
jgi:MFS family permease